MAVARHAGTAARAALAQVALAFAALLPPGAGAVPLTPDELAKVCAQAEGPAHCGRMVEDVQLKRLPNLAVRDGVTLKVSLYPSGAMTFADTESLHGGRSYSLWDFVNELNAVVLYMTDDGNASFTLLQRTNGRSIDLPAEPKVSPDRARLVTADFCAARCVNELAIWRVTRDGVRKELVWRPDSPWADAVATWKDAETLTIDYMAAGATSRSRLSRRVADADWARPPAP